MKSEFEKIQENTFNDLEQNAKDYLRSRGYSMFPLYSYHDLSEWLNEDGDDIGPKEGSGILEEILDGEWVNEQIQFEIDSWMEENGFERKNNEL